MADIRRTIDGIHAKLDRAQELLNLVNEEWPAWVAQEKPWGTETEIGEGQHRCIVVFRILKPLPLRFSVMGGEVVHDMRSALDHLAGYLVEASGARPTNHTAWPLQKNAAGWRRNVERRRRPWQLRRKKGGGPLKGIPVGSDAWALVQSTQTRDGRNQARNEALWELNQLWNADKHRVLHATPIYTDPNSLLDAIKLPLEPVDRKVIVPADHPLKDGTKLALFRFDRLVPADMKVQAKLTLQVTLGDQKGNGVALRETIETIRTLTDTATKLCRPG